jgi:hypothetical protein
LEISQHLNKQLELKSNQIFQIWKLMKIGSKKLLAFNLHFINYVVDFLIKVCNFFKTTTLPQDMNHKIILRVKLDKFIKFNIKKENS